jgi:hypothetical protein
MNIKGTILFKESQSFRVKWLWAVIILCSLSSVGLTLGLAMAEKESMKEAMITFTFVIPLEALILYLFYIARLETTISTEGIYYRWRPFQRKSRFISKDEIAKAELRPVPSLNYGYHWVPGYGRAHIMAPGKGMQFVLKNGKKIFLGTQKNTALQLAIEKIMTVSQQV